MTTKNTLRDKQIQVVCKTCGEEYTLSWKANAKPTDIAIGIEIMLNERECDVCDDINWSTNKEGEEQ